MGMAPGYPQKKFKQFIISPYIIFKIKKFLNKNCLEYNYTQTVKDIYLCIFLYMAPEGWIIYLI